MNSGQVVSYFSHPKARERRREIDPRLQNLVNQSEVLMKTPVDWGMKNSINYTPTYPEFLTDLKRLRNITSYPNEQKVLTLHLKRVVGTFLEHPDPEQYTTPPKTRMEWFIRTGEWIDIRMAAESSLLLYSLGPFTFDYDPWKYINQEHEDLRKEMGKFGVNIYRFLAESANERQAPTLEIIANYFERLGDAFRDLSWENR